MMTPEQALDLAKFQRPGVRLIVGPTEAREVRTEPRDVPTNWRAPQPATWLEYDLRRRLGFIPSAWAMFFAAQYERITGKQPSDAEWLWLHRNDGQGASLNDVRGWLSTAA